MLSLSLFATSIHLCKYRWSCSLAHSPVWHALCFTPGARGSPVLPLQFLGGWLGTLFWQWVPRFLGFPLFWAAPWSPDSSRSRDGGVVTRDTTPPPLGGLVPLVITPGALWAEFTGNFGRVSLPSYWGQLMATTINDCDWPDALTQVLLYLHSQHLLHMLRNSMVEK